MHGLAGVDRDRRFSSVRVFHTDVASSLAYRDEALFLQNPDEITARNRGQFRHSTE